MASAHPLTHSRSDLSPPRSRSPDGSRPQSVGILAMELYVPLTYVAQTALEHQDGCAGKYVTGLGQDAMAFVDDREDVVSILLNACAALLDKYSIDPSEVGRLEVGTETLIDKSKSAKTALLRLFPGCSDIEGVTSTNACYGGTAALFNSVAWVESSAWDGRFAVVVCGDVAVYEKGPARPSGGCGAVAMLVGPDAPLWLSRPRATCALDMWDFYKPLGHSEYAAVDGKLSQACYLRSVDECWRLLRRKAGGARLTSYQFCAFHAPYNKLVQKGFGRVLLGDAVAIATKADGGDHQEGRPLGPEAQALAATWCNPGDPAYEASLVDRTLELTVRGAAKDTYEAMLEPSTTIPKAIGNTYTASVFTGIASLVASKRAELGAGAKVLVFSYGSGSVATMYTLVGRSKATEARFSLDKMASVLDVDAKLANRVECSAAHFGAACDVREHAYGRADYVPTGAPDPATGKVEPLAPGAFYLAKIDAAHRREYARAPP